MLDGINKVVKFFILSDLLLFMGWGFIAPILAIFIIDKVAGATLLTVGIANAVYWSMRSIVQVPTALALDREKGEKDDYYTLIVSLLVVGAAAFMLAFVETRTTLYLVQALHGIGFGIYQVAWPAIYSRHMDKGKVALDWSLDRGSVGLVVAITSFVGAGAAQVFGFSTVFIWAGVVSVMSALVLLTIPDAILKKSETGELTKVFVRLQGKHKQRG